MSDETTPAVLKERLDWHRERLDKIDSNFSALSNKLDTLNKSVWMGIGIFVTLNAVLGYLAVLHR